MEDLEKLKYPIGHFNCPENISNEDIEKWIQVLDVLPERLSNLVNSFSEEQLNTPYRDGGWTVRQVIHHMADSHHHSYTRFKWALTENRPLIKVYEEKLWSELIDAKTAPISLSLSYLTALHAKLVYLLNHLDSVDFEKSYIHPEGSVNVSVAENIGKYAWHSNHHFAHIENLALSKGW
ncbi:YfiT family bacillithiol transferase [Maribacter sp. 1_MG-2023]|uniref:YfiT family bacillithiol transferase n=1 Tax=Maribacter sp. 1_MG-2023 TaxID=3062677 RepID=UPI0026E26265|nr:putative metal-dependent hydrolase [Maribacter sp. 1_MG-2023]MDO6470508.1 putative metal-dependent hydrolase [Maribacter sp. 1_MG-2023]